MDKRIKALYIITILAILLFLGMQVYWLYGRYVFSLAEYERNLIQKISQSVELYNGLRDSADNIFAGGDSVGQKMMFPVISLSISKDDTVRTSRKVSVYTYSYHTILGLDSNVQLTKEMMKKAVNEVYDYTGHNRKMASDSIHYDASRAKDENETWAAAHNIVTAKERPFTREGIDSVLRKNGINADVRIMQLDSMVWNNSVRHDGRLWNSELSVSIPFSQLEGRIVEIKCRINPFEVLPMMWSTLAVVFVITMLLIICLVLQIGTVLRLSRLDKMRNSFITTMIHELKRPISTLKMCVSGLDNERLSDDHAIRKELLTETRNALDNLSAYFSKLRDITFNNNEQIPLNLQSVDIRYLFDNVTEAAVSPSWKTVEIHNEIAPETIVTADKTHLANIMSNLIENAVKYSGAHVEITAQASVNEGMVSLRISDTGLGIPSSDLRRIFQRFYRGKAAGEISPAWGSVWPT